MGFCGVDWDVDEKERARGVRVWKSWFVRAEVEMVCSGEGEAGSWRELKRQDCVSCYFVRCSFHLDVGQSDRLSGGECCDCT